MSSAGSVSECSFSPEFLINGVHINVNPLYK